jgi:hypothetical protein
VAQRGKFLEDAQVVETDLTDDKRHVTESSKQPKTEDEQIEEYKQLVKDIENTPLNQSSEPVNRRQPKEVEKVSSMAIRKEYLVRMNKAENLDELKIIHDEFVKNDGLTGQHLAYLKDTYTQYKDKFEAATAEAPKAETIKVDPIKSGLKRDGFIRMFNEAKTWMS